MVKRTYEIKGDWLTGYAVLFGEPDEDGEYFTRDTIFVHEDEVDLKLLTIQRPINKASEPVTSVTIDKTLMGLLIQVHIDARIQQHLTPDSHFCVMGEFEADEDGKVTHAKINSIGLTDKLLFG